MIDTPMTDKEIIETFRLCASAKCKECDRDIHDCQKIYKEAYDLLTRLTATGDGYKIKCSRQDDCGNFPARCHECHAMADIIHHKPYYRHKDNVHVVRCKDCARLGHYSCPLSYVERQELIFINHDPEFFCAAGVREGEEVDDL